MVLRPRTGQGKRRWAQLHVTSLVSSGCVLSVSPKACAAVGHVKEARAHIQPDPCVPMLWGCLPSVTAATDPSEFTSCTR